MFQRSLKFATLTIVCTTCVIACGTSKIIADQRPNILFLFSDDQRADTIGALGNELIKTPHIDKLVRRGTYFPRAYCMGSPHGAVCVPSRAMLMSGKSLFRTDLKLNDQTTFPQLLGDDGYVTFGTGKWHNGQSSFARSFQQGKTIMFGGMSDHLKVPLCNMNTDRTFSEKTTGTGFSSTMFADAAIDFLENADKEKPFLCYVAFTAPHDPRMPPSPYDTMYDRELPELPSNFLPRHPFDTGQMTIRDEVLAGWPRTESIVRQQLAEYYGMITQMDAQIGRILSVLNSRGLADNTIIVFASDHGLAIGSHGLLGKQSLYEHSMNAPLLLCGPGIPQGEIRDAFVYIHDLFPTVCDYAKVAVPDDVDSVSLKPVIDGTQTDQRMSMFTSYAKLMRAVRTDRWKLVRWPQIDRTQLFDLQSDPAEINDLAGDPRYKRQIEVLTELLADWQKRSDDVQPLVVENPKSDKIDLTNVRRKPDQWQPKWIVDKYFDGVPHGPKKQKSGKQKK